MSTAILATKLYVPTLRPKIVPRPHLTERLNEGLSASCKLTLISGPAGFGKTTLVSEWIASCGRPVAWLSLDEGDNEPARFLNYLIAALQTIATDIGEGVLPMLQSPQPPSAESILTALLNEITIMPDNFVIVLDDYHVIDSKPVDDAITFLLEHLPPHMHLVIATREDPHLPLARLRARGQLTELRAADLRFTPSEASEFLNYVMGLNLSEEDIAALEARTEGWIAGLQLAAISMRDHKDATGFIQSFTGSHRFVMDYLLEEVLHQQPESIQTFLLRTSILDRLSGPLCDAVTGRSDSQAVLNSLERANLFLVSLDNRREWFRYHQLFASLLYQRLVDSNGAEAVKALRQRAGGWYAAHGYAIEAIEILLASQDFEQAAELIERSAEYLFAVNELNLVVKWSTIIPEAVIAARPRLNMVSAWGSQVTGHPQQSSHLLDLLETSIGMTAEEFVGAAPSPQALSPLQRASLIEAGVLRSRLAVDSLQLEKAFTLGERLLPYLVPGATSEAHAFNYPYLYRAGQLSIQGQVHQFRGNLDAAADMLIRADGDAEEVINPHIIALALGHLGEIQALQGHLTEAKRTFERAIQRGRKFSPYSSAFWGLASIGLGNLALEQNDLAEAEAQLKTGLELGKLWHVWECLLPGCIGQARIHAVYGEWEEAFANLDELVALASLNLHTVQPAVEANRAFLALRRGDLERSGYWAATFDLHSSVPYPLQWEQNALIAGRIWVAERKLADAEALFKELLSTATTLGHGKTIIELHMLQALWAAQQDQAGQACQAILQALKLAAPGGYVRLFVDEGEPLRTLLEACLPSIHDSAVLEYSGLLLGAFSKPVRSRPSPVPQVIQADQSKLIEPLSERELEVLKLLRSELSGPEIAQQLFVSLNTLRTHTKSIFNKLGVNNRRAAVRRAEELDLI